MYRSVWRDITTHKIQFVGIAIMIALGAGSMGMFIPSYYNLARTYDLTYEKLGLADFRVTTVLQTEQLQIDRVRTVIEDLKNTYPIASYEFRIVSEMTAVENTSEGVALISIRAIGLNVTGGRHPKVNDVAVIQGRWFIDADRWNDSRSYNEYVGLVDGKLARYHNLTPNDRISLLVDGDINSTTQARVIGEVGTAEYLWIAASWQDLMPSPRRFGLVFFPLTSMQHMLGWGENDANDVCIRMTPGTPTEVRNDLMDELERRLRTAGISIMPPIPKEREPSYAGLKLDLEGFTEMVAMLPAFILIIACFSTYVTMSRLIAAQRREVGITMALGYSKGDIYRKYLRYGLIIGTVGGGIGILLGEVFTHMFVDMYLGMMIVPFRYYGVYPEIIVASFVIPLIITLIGCYIPARSSARLIPSVAMKNDPANVVMGRVTLIERGIKRMSGYEPRVRTKIILRNLFRNRRRTLSTMIGIMLSFVLICSTAGMNDSMNATVEAIKVREGWNIQVQYIDFKMAGDINADLNLINSWPEVDLAYRGITFSTVLTSNFTDSETPLQIRVQDPANAIHDFQFGKNGGAFNDSGIVITKGTANKLGVTVGNRIAVMHPRFNITSLTPLRYSFEMVNSSVVVVGISQETTSLVCWMSYKLAGQLIGEEELDANTLYIRLKDPTPNNINRVKQRIFTSIKKVRSALSPTDIGQDIGDYMKFLRLFLMMLIGFSVTLAASIFLTTSVINVLERKRDVATIMTLGTDHKSISFDFFMETLVILVGAIILGIPISYEALVEMGASFSNDFMDLLITIEPITYLISIAIIFVATLLVQWFLVRGFRKMNLAQETKRRIT